jgi:uncharacterized membrane protein HdeD (DUF308 family)
MKRKWLFQNWWLQTVKGLTFVAFSGCALIFPMAVLWPYFGWLLLFAGSLNTILALSNQLRIHTWTWLLTAGIFDLTVGLLAVSQPVVTVEVFAYVLGLWMVFSGVVHLMTSLTLVRLVKNWWIIRMIGLYSILIGFLTLYRLPFELSALLAVYGLIIGSFYTLSSFQLRKINQVWLQNVLS